MIDFKGKKILITGASSGIGRATAIQASRYGAKVIIVGRKPEELGITLQQMNGCNHQSFVIDFMSDDLSLSLKAMFKQVGQIDGLFHCAGVHFTSPLKVQDISNTELLFKINVFSAMTVIKELRKKNNHNSMCSVVLMSSASAILGEAAISAYASSKSAIIGLTKSLAAELVTDGMRVNCISAGIVKTAMTDKLFDGLDPSYVQAIESKHALGFGEPSDVANAALFLLSSSSKWITGTNLVIDGGYTAVK